MKTEVVKAVNEQIYYEFLSAHLYLNMSVQMDAAGFPGYGRWLRTQWHEELTHAEQLIDFLQRRNEEAVLREIPLEPVASTKPQDIAQAVLEHEQLVTSKIYALRKLAQDEGDQALEVFLNTFVAEQVEEEENAQDVIDMFAGVGKMPGYVHHIDMILGKRKE